MRAVAFHRRVQPKLILWWLRDPGASFGEDVVGCQTNVSPRGGPGEDGSAVENRSITPYKKRSCCHPEALLRDVTLAFFIITKVALSRIACNPQSHVIENNEREL